MSRIKELDTQRQIELRGAAVVVRDEAGQIEVKDEVADDRYTGTATGGLVGLIIGILGGPFGVLIGAATGVLVGSLFDLQDEEDTESAISESLTRSGRWARPRFGGPQRLAPLPSQRRTRSQWATGRST